MRFSPSIQPFWMLLIGWSAVLAACPAVIAEETAKTPAEPTPEQAQFFEAKIRPILVENCHKCHGEQKQNGKLRLDSRSALLAGGESGAAAVPGKPEESLLIEAINYKSLEMPPQTRLKPDQIALLTEWVKSGAAWPGSNSDAPLAPRKGALQVTDADRQFWSFQPPRGVAIPQLPADLARSGRNALDLFLLESLAQKQLALSAEASRRELVRRATFDLIGLPPTSAEIETFIASDAPDAYERLLDELLASPQHGERWGRHWLDVVRFAQTNGYERDDEKPSAWRYRDYVIRALNQDKPYNRFLLEQLAGDELVPLTDDSLTATAFIHLGVWDDEPDDGKQAKADSLDDIVSTSCAAMLGLTVGCARCHDHKFDPIAQEDYYSFTAFFQNIQLYGKTPDVVGGGVPINREGILRDLPSGAGQTLAVSEKSEPPPPSHILIRGSAATPGKLVKPRFIQVLCSSAEASEPQLPEQSPDPRDAAAKKSISTKGRRLAIAQWIASPANPLTARVLVNRLWHYHFGRGIVATPSDFGHTGMKPSHPQLLDFLAHDLVGGDWQLKRLHRRMMGSAAYRQSSRAENQHALLVDPDNTLLWRQNLRRLEAEAIRDSLLFAAGSLNYQMGGRGIFPTLPAEVLAGQSRPGSGWDNQTPAAQQARRSVYIFVKRTLGVPLLDSFDFAATESPTARRNTTTVAPQSLLLLNSDFLQQQADALAQRIMRQSAKASASRIDLVYRQALGRAPTTHEQQVAAGFLTRETIRWEKLAQEQPNLLRPAEPQPAQQLLNWTRFGGIWSALDGGYSVEPSPGAKIVHDRARLADGVVEADVLLRTPGGDAGLLLRVANPSDGVDSVAAYNINFLHDLLRLGKHENNWRQLAAAPAKIEVGKWQHLKVQLDGGRIRIWLDGAAEPALDFTDPKPLPAGQIGFRTFQAAAAVRKVQITADGKSTKVEMQTDSYRPPEVSAAEERALAAFCKLVLNLNEFIYVD